MFPTSLTKEYPEAINFLTNALFKNKLANAYIFIGKDDVANLDIACNLAKILNCKENLKTLNTPCGKCINCLWIEEKEHPQALIIVSPEEKSKKDQIKVDTIREILSTLTTTSNFYRIIFFQSSNLTYLPRESCNLLLKVVEEAPENTTFIFANATKNDILPTILSRSQTMHINKKYDSIQEVVVNKDTKIPDEHTTIPSFSNEQTALEKAKELQGYIQKNEIDLKDYLIAVAMKNYEIKKDSDKNQLCSLYKELTNAYLKHKHFMQPKIVIEDLYLACVKT